MSRYKYEAGGIIIDTEMDNFPYHTDDIVKFLEEKDDKIAELEEQLKNKPKFNVGNKVYFINEDKEVESDFIEEIEIDEDGISYYTIMYSICWYEKELFATKEEAQAKLEELKGE